jgi:hypothetical protein
MILSNSYTHGKEFSEKCVTFQIFTAMTMINVLYCECYGMQSGRKLPTFRRNVLCLSSGSKSKKDEQQVEKAQRVNRTTDIERGLLPILVSSALPRNVCEFLIDHMP